MELSLAGQEPALSERLRLPRAEPNGHVQRLDLVGRSIECGAKSAEQRSRVSLSPSRALVNSFNGTVLAANY
jgi:hypothetical protein